MDATDDAVPDPLMPDRGRASTPEGSDACIVRVLGPLEVMSAGVAASLGSPKQRALLVLLALNANEVVSTDRLVFLLWGDDAPRTAVHSIQIYVSELRKALAVLASAPVIATVSTGYRLEIRSDAVDVHRFERLVQDGRRALRARESAAGLSALRAAVGLWRGTALQEFAYDDFAQPQIRRLGDLRLDVIEELAAAELAAGQVREALQRIEAAVDDDPLREGFVELLMLGLYRSGRHVHALRAYQSHRQLLAEELGVVPSPTLQRLYERILVHDPSLRPELTDARPHQGLRHNPYKGLRPFRESDSGDFFGRDHLVQKTIALLSGGQRLVSLVGPSGSGKSSVVAAGLIPQLRAGAIAGSADWPIISLILGADPLRELAAAITRETGGSSRESAGDLHEEDTDLLPSLPELPEDGRVVIVLDQFEQLFLAADETSQRRFLDALLAALTVTDPRLMVVLTLRADHYDRPLRNAGFAATFAPGVLNVLPMTSTEIEAAVVGPAAGVGVDVDPELLAELVADTADQPGSLPLLQFALTDLFDRATAARLTLDDYTALGGLRGILARRADDLYDSLNEQEQGVAMQLLLRMVRIGRGSDDAGRRVLMSEFTSLDLDPVALSEVLDQFSRNRLLSFDRDQNTGAPTVELAHEALLKQWDRLADWVETHRESLHRVESIRIAAANWQDSGRHPDYLLAGVRLAEAETHTSNSALSLSANERQFVEASVDREKAEQNAESARLVEQRQLERRARRRLVGLAVAVILAIGAVVVGVVTHGGAKAKHVALFYSTSGELGLMISAGFDRGVSDFGFVAKKIEGDSADPTTHLNAFSAGQQLIVVFQIGSDVEAVAQHHADTRYVLLDRRVDAPNVTSVEFADNQGSYLVGAAAALKTKTGTIGFVGGVDTDVIWQFQAGFEAGAKAINPGIRIVTTYLASPPNYSDGFLNPPAGEAAARKLYAAGVDVVFAAAGTSGLGVFQAATDLSTPDRYLWAIGVDSDQYNTVTTLPGTVNSSAWQAHILTSMIKRYDTAVYSVLDSYAHGHLEPTPQLLGLAENGVEISYSGGYINDIQPRIEALRNQIISGEVKVSCRPSDRPPLSASNASLACGP